MAERRKVSRAKLAVMVGGVAIVAAALIVFAVMRGGPSDDQFSIRGVLPLTDGSLLLVERAGMSNDTYDRGRLRVVSREGRELRRSKTVKSALVGHGVAADHVWVTSHDDGLEAWRVSDLAPVPGGAAAIEGHPMLSRKRNVVGLTGDAVVVRAADHRHYTITGTYAIAKQPEDFAYRAIAARSGSVDMFPLTVETGTGHLRAGTSLPRDLDLVHPRAVLELDPGAVLATGKDFEGVGNSAIVGRVENGAMAWSIAARDLIGPHDLGRDAIYTYKLAELRDGLLWLVAEAAVWHQPRSDSSSRTRGHGEYAQQIASIDPKTGAIRSSHRITNAP